MPPGMADEKGLHCIPIPQNMLSLDFGYLYAANRPPSSIAQQFLKLLDEELEFLSDDGLDKNCTSPQN